MLMMNFQLSLALLLLLLLQYGHGMEMIKRNCCCCEFKDEATYAYLTDCSKTCSETLGKIDINATKVVSLNVQYSNIVNIPVDFVTHGSRNRFCMSTCAEAGKHLKHRVYIVDVMKTKPPPPKKRIKYEIVQPPLCLWYNKTNSYIRDSCKKDAWSPVRHAIDKTMSGYADVDRMMREHALSMNPSVKMALTQVYTDEWRSHCMLWKCLSNVTTKFYELKVHETITRLNQVNLIPTSPCHGVFGVNCTDNCVKSYS